MNLQTFKASTMAEALSQVKSSMGHDAVILHTRTFFTRQWLGLRRREMVEITAGKGLNVGERNSRRAALAPRVAVAQPAMAGGAYTRQALLNGPAAVPARAPEASPRQTLLDMPVARDAMMTGLNQDMGALKAMVADLVKQTRAASAPQVPEDLLEYYVQMISNQVADELATEVLKTVQKQMRGEPANPAIVRERIAEQLEKMIPVSGPIRRTKTTGPHVVALIGPTGVGKTTTLAKLAANLKLRGKHRVGLITLDTYRIAAVDQLRKYADIIGSPLKVVSTADDLRDAVNGMRDCEFVLIDTAGRSPRDEMRLNELRGLLSAVEPDEVHLVLTATASQESVQMAITKFSEVRVDRIIFTKLDEAAHVGVVLNIARKVGKNLSYVTTGQDVPDDIEECHGRKLAQMIFGA